VIAALHELIGQGSTSHDLARVWLAMAAGDPSTLQQRKPDFRWFKEMLDHTQGNIPAASPAGPGDEIADEPNDIPDYDDRYAPGDPRRCETEARAEATNPSP
jgi:hypothetical protein